ncbi:hypothetical protein ACRBEV_00860 [Methylobacterium phyllosphaerae]
MTDRRPPFRPADAVDVLGEVEGDFVLPLCLPQPDLLIGEDLAMLVLDTIHGQRIGLPSARRARPISTRSWARPCGCCRRGTGVRSSRRGGPRPDPAPGKASLRRRG